MIPEDLEIRDSSIHGTGVFALKSIPRGKKLIEYTGRRISKAESLKLCQADNRYVFEIDDETDLDGDVPTNPARLINHSCNPNCEAINEEGRIWIYTLRRIPRGAEVTFNYGYDLVDCEEHPCKCGSPHCLGVILGAQFHDEYRRLKSLQPPQSALKPTPPTR